MSLAKTLIGGIVLLALAGIAVLAFVMSRTEACGPFESVASEAPSMTAVLHRCYGPADLLELASVERPVPGDDEVLVRVHAAALNPLDWHYMTGTPYVMRFESGLGRPTSDRLGVDFAGTVAAVGRNVTAFQPGDAVYGSRWGAFAEYVKVTQGKALVPKPTNLTFAQAAGVPVAAVTALQALRDKAQVKPGQKVLVNGASGGVGTFAVQIAKALGAEVTGVCSTRNVELVRSLGADHVIDYTSTDFTSVQDRYDVVFDVAGKSSFGASKGALRAGGVYLDTYPSLGTVWHMLVTSRFGRKRAVFAATGLRKAGEKRPDLELVGKLFETGILTPVIDRRYRMEQAAEAHAYVDRGHKVGNVVLAMAGEGMA
jgi:NADPH:quinone reductase-like Zn-dependent oxidoreductase